MVFQIGYLQKIEKPQCPFTFEDSEIHIKTINTTKICMKIMLFTKG